ncbi:glutamate receptor ionotropic, NMDA 1-like [Galendromus occidentalis]|uniref:Glutamate receptor ionotropic, NMDA 1-like n=1 Tax=Galendromus occidentalis TaxID=34638 RepID=A0AAJ7WHP3_9ACAR|nr:glutamate receptor ionotropic, NMDA 1-like [Galendromus occidentalis]
MNYSGVIRVATFEYYPYQTFEGPGRNVPIQGFNGHLIQALSESMSLEYEIVESGAWGLEMKNGSWSGALGKLQRGEADMTLCPTNPTAEKMLIAEQTYPLHPIELMLMNGRLSTFEQNPFAIVLALQGSVWLALISGLFVMALLMSLFHFILCEMFTDVVKVSLSNALGTYIFVLAGNALNEGSTNPPPNRDSIRILWISWFLAVSLILMSVFAGQLKASIMFKPGKPRIETLLDLHRSKHALYVAKDSAGEQALRTHSADYVQAIYRRMLREKTNVNAKEILNKKVLELILREEASVITSRPVEAIAAEGKCREMPRGEFYVSQNPVLSFNAVFHMSFDLREDIRRGINDRINWLADCGVLDKWWEEIAGVWSGCSRGDAKEFDSMSLTDFEAVAYIWSIGILGSIIAFIFEIALQWTA